MPPPGPSRLPRRALLAGCGDSGPPRPGANYTVRRGDTLARLAGRAYGDPAA